MTKRLELSAGKVATVDDEDYEALSAHKWSFDPKGYAQRKKDGRVVLLHREILGAPPRLQVDHVNGDGLDNRRANIRLVTAHQNRTNTRKTEQATTSKYKGVYWHKTACKWQAHIRIDLKLIYLGTFEIETDAAKAYDAAALEAWGVYARPNFPPASNAKAF